MKLLHLSGHGTQGIFREHRFSKIVNKHPVKLPVAPVAPGVSPLRDAWAPSPSSRGDFVPGSSPEGLAGLQGIFQSGHFPGSRFPGGGSRVCLSWGLPEERLAGRRRSRARAPAARVGPSGQSNSTTRARGVWRALSLTRARSEAHGALNEPTGGALPVQIR